MNLQITAPVKVEIQLITQYKEQLRYSPPKEFKYLPKTESSTEEVRKPHDQHILTDNTFQLTQNVHRMVKLHSA